MHITGMFSMADLEEAIAQGYVRRQAHPSLPLYILNYTEKSVYEHVWTKVTRQCRGLIVSEDGQVVARPFSKFWNYGEQEPAPSYYHSPVTVTDKFDGSMGVYWEYDGVRGVATRGSFTSMQALHATEVLNTRYSDYRPVPGMTTLWEIIFKANRIVLDYGDLDDLVLLGAVSIEDGWTTGPFDPDWPGPRTQVFEADTFQQALEMPPRPNAEGSVVHFHDSDTSLKIKQIDYLQAHAIVTRTSTKTIWKTLSEGGDIRTITELVPDEFAQWTEQVAADLKTAKNNWISAAEVEFAKMPKHCDRRTFALEALKSTYSAALFFLLDGKDLEEMAWKAVRPE